MVQLAWRSLHHSLIPRPHRAASRCPAPITQLPLFLFLIFHFKGLGQRLLIFMKSLLGTSGWERVCIKRSAGHRDFGHVFHDGPSCPDCGDNPPTHPFTLLLLCIFRQEFPSQLGANGTLPVASCLLPGSLCCSFRAKRKTSYLITLYTQREKPHSPRRKPTWA